MNIKNRISMSDICNIYADDGTDELLRLLDNEPEIFDDFPSLQKAVLDCQTAHKCIMAIIGDI